MGFVVEEKSFSAENGCSIIPGYALYRAYAILETAVVNETPFSASDVFVWDRELAQVLMMLVIDFVWLSLVLWLCDTGLIFKWTKFLGNCCIANSSTAHNCCPQPRQKSDAELQEEEDELASRLPPVTADLKGRITESLVVADQMQKTYRPKNAAPTWACRGVSLEVGKGTVYGLLGPNGAGKSTMMSMLTGIEVPDGGDGYVYGNSVTWVCWFVCMSICVGGELGLVVFTGFGA